MTTMFCSTYVQAVPLQFLHALQLYLGDSVDYDNGSSGLKSPLASPVSSFPGVNMPSELLVRWKLRLEYFAYETLQDLRIGKLFEIIVDYPDRFCFFFLFSHVLLNIEVCFFMVICCLMLWLLSIE